MSEDTKPITETALETKSNIETARETKVVETAKPFTPIVDTGKVRVKPLRSYTDSETGKHVTPESEAYDVSKHRAIQLRQNGLVEYDTAEDEHEAVAEQVKANAAKIADRNRQSQIADKDKGTPLKNPPLRRS